MTEPLTHVIRPTLPAKNAPEDDWADWALDAEGQLRERLRLALVMLRRALTGWTIDQLEPDGDWWWLRIHNDEPFDRPDMALTPDETELWEALRKDRP